MALAILTTMSRRCLLAVTLVVASLFISSSVEAQQGSAGTPARELDQALVNLSTTLPLHRHKSYFRITHRFARDLRRGSFGQLAEDFFSLDNGAIIGLEYRFGVTERLQAGVNRSILGKTLETFGRFDAWQQGGARPIGVSATVSVEGQNNLRLDPQPAVSATISRVQGRVALYAAPTFVKDAHTPTLRLIHEGHSHPSGDEDAADASAHLDQNDTAFIGLGARLRVLESLSLVFEMSPRLYGYRPDRASWNTGVEKETRGHVLQLNFGNNFGTTPGQVARGGSSHDVYLGFNLSRKF
jgi:hypothetical protein